MKRPSSKAPELDEVKAEQRPGRCAFCDLPLGPRRTVSCGREECNREHANIFCRAYKRRVAREAHP